MNMGDYLIPKEDYDELFSDYIELVQREEQLQNNWNELKKHCNTMLSIFEKMNDKNKQEQLDKYVIYDKFLSKMQELEQVKD